MLSTGPALIELSIDADRPTAFPQFLPKGAQACLHFSVCRRERHQDPDPAYSLALLRARRKRPCDRRAAKQRDELTSF
jgi:hypothetical protein